jgi:hypothetical protein
MASADAAPLQVDNDGNVYTLVPRKCFVAKLDKQTQKAYAFYGTPGVCGNGTNQFGSALVSGLTWLATTMCMNNARTTLYVVDEANGGARLCRHRLSPLASSASHVCVAR